MAKKLSLEPRKLGWKITGPGKLIVIIDAARVAGIRITVDELKEYILLLRLEHQIYFGYRFSVRKTIRSGDLEEDIFVLKAADYITIDTNNELSLMYRGLQWLREEIEQDPKPRSELTRATRHALRFYYELGREGRKKRATRKWERLQRLRATNPRKTWHWHY